MVVGSFCRPLTGAKAEGVIAPGRTHLNFPKGHGFLSGSSSVPHSGARTASFRFLSAVNLHHGFEGPPSMYRTAAIKVSSRQGSWRFPVTRHMSSYMAYGLRPA